MLPRYRITEANLDYKLKNRKGMLSTDEYVCNLKRHGIESTIPDEPYKGANTSIYHICKIHNHRFKAQPSNVMNGYPCPLCNQEKVRITNEVNYKQKLLDKNIPVILDEKYISHSEKVYHICLLCNNRWKTTPSHILKNKYACPRCAKIETAKSRTKTQKEYENEVFNLFGDSLYIIDKYTGAKNIIEVHCNICGHNWKPLAENLIQGHGCPHCRDINTGNRFRKTIDQYKKEVSDLYKDIVVVADKYENINTPILHQCTLCLYTYYQTPSNVLQGYGKCPLCNKCYEISENEFKELLHRNGKQVKLLSPYTSKISNIDCQCLICNYIWTTTASGLLNTVFNCPNCAIRENKAHAQKSHDTYVLEVLSFNPYIRILSQYNGGKNNIEAQCLLCNNVWKTKANNLLRLRCGCPKCTSSKGELLVQSCLDKYKICYIKTRKYPDLIGVRNGQLSYDFYLPTYNLLIECQGEQHERPVEHFGGKKQFVIQTIHDTRKRRYAHEHNINLLEIWYYENNKIDKILTQTLNSLKSESVETVIPA